MEPESFRQDRVARAVWPWADPAGGAQAGASPARRRALIQFAVMAVIAGLLCLRPTWRPMAVIAGSLALFVLLTGLLAPRVFEAVDRALKAFGKLVGVALTWLFLAPVFFLVFMPGRLLLALKGQDPMQRQFPTQAPTYWVPYRKPPGVARYRKQYQ